MRYARGRRFAPADVENLIPVAGYGPYQLRNYPLWIFEISKRLRTCIRERMRM